MITNQFDIFQKNNFVKFYENLFTINVKNRGPVKNIVQNTIFSYKYAVKRVNYLLFEIINSFLLVFT